MNVLIFDTETTGFIKKAPPSDPGQPGLMEIGIISCVDGVWKEWDSLVQCSQEPTPGAFNAHGISQEDTAKGVTLTHAVLKLSEEIHKVDRVICHNAKYDIEIMHIAAVRCRVSPEFIYKKRAICTMQSLTSVMKIPKRYGSGYKWPSLDEAYRKYVNNLGFSSAHRAINDALATRNVYIAMEELNIEFLSPNNSRWQVI